MDNRDRRHGNRCRAANRPTPDSLPPTAWRAQPSRSDVEASALTIAELIALVRETGGTVGGYGLWDPRHEDEVRRMLTTALEMEGVLPPGSVAKLRR